MRCLGILQFENIVMNVGRGKQTQISGVLGKHPTHHANSVNTLGENYNMAHIARIATLTFI